MKLIGVYSAAPRLLVPASQKKAWKGDYPESAFEAAERAKAVAATIAVKNVSMLALRAELGAVGWLPAEDGGVFVCWGDAAKSGTGELAEAKVKKVLDAVATWKPVGSHELNGPQFLAAGEDLAPADRGFSWIDVPLVGGTYAIEAAAPTKTPLGKIGFIRLRAAGAPSPKKSDRAMTTENVETASPTVATPAATVTPGPDGAVLLPADLAKEWDHAKDWTRASTMKATKALSITVGDVDAIVLGTDVGVAYVPTEHGALLVMRDAANDWPSAVQAAAGIPSKEWKRRATPFRVGRGGVVLLHSATDDRRAGSSKPLPLGEGTYDVEFAWGANVEGVGVSAVKLVRRA